MRGYTEVGKLVNESIVAERKNGFGEPEYRAELRIAGHGTFLGEWLSRSNIAQQELDLLVAKHQPSKPNNDGISPEQAADFHAALSDVGDKGAMLVGALAAC